MFVEFANKLPIIEIWHLRYSENLIFTKKKYIKIDRFDILHNKSLLNFFKISFVIHVISGHHDYFVVRYGIRIVMIHQHAINYTSS